MEFSMYRGNPKNSALESAQDWKFRSGNEKTNKTFARILKLYLTFFQRYTYRVLQTIQMKLVVLCVWAEPAVLGSAKTALKFKCEI